MPPGTPPTTAAAPTWSYLVTTYLGAGTIGHCSTGCHHHGSTFSSATAAYSYLKSAGYISGTASPLVDNAQSCLSWFGGGTMPPSGPTSSPPATKDFKAWVAAGALNN